MSPKFLQILWRRTFNNVIFGICLMVAVALYVAIGSGRPDVREFFEMNELQFFSAWPLKLLMAMLVLNLATVTWTRIPFTPPRYGVWCIHAGIITLICGMAIYYNRKVEGTVRLWVDPRDGPVWANSFYDAAERALYVRVGDTLWNWYPLAALPRFKAYDESLGNAEFLKRPGLHDIIPTRAFHAGQDSVKEQSLTKLLGLEGDLRIDITGYWPYANIVTNFSADSAGGMPGIRITAPGAHSAETMPEAWLVGADARNASSSIESTELEHKHRPSDLADAMRQSATHLHRVDVKLPNHQETLYLEPGKSYPLGQTGYTISIENFNPAWPMFGTNEIVKTLTLKVKSPAGAGEFRRMILDGKELQTDFKLDEAGAGPMGKRQKEPLDKDLVLLYRLEDPFHLLPREGAVKHTLVTVAESKALVDIATGLSQPAEIRELVDGAGDVEIASADSINAPFAPHAEAESARRSFVIHIERNDHVRRNDRVEIVPPARRQRDFGESGAFQVLKAHLRLGDWSQDVLVPFSEDAVDSRWEGATVQLPGSSIPIQLQLGRNRLPLPDNVKLTLKRFEAVPYPGGDVSENAMMREFRSTVVIDNPVTGEQQTDAAHLNNPIYFNGGRWLFFQASYDGQAQRWTALGVGNRPGVWIMTLGCVMIVGGFLYAFYVKPILVRRMKEKALTDAQKSAAPRTGKKRDVPALVGDAV